MTRFEKTELKNAFYQYDQYTNFEEQYYQSEEYQAMREYWKTRLSGFDISGKEFAYGNLQTALSEVTASECRGSICP
ncbi:MAG: hypothetical protein ACLR23_12725 [Clostridia bacterium]